jgi:hypothetical protein
MGAKSSAPRWPHDLAHHDFAVSRWVAALGLGMKLRDCSLGIDSGFLEQVEEDAGGKIGEFLGITMSFSAKPCEVDAETVVVAFDGKGVGLALQMSVRGEDQAVGVPEVGAEGDVQGVRKLRIQTAGRVGSTIPQRPAADLFGSTINSPPEPAGRFFWPT